MATEIKFRRDTNLRNLLFTPESFAHPAKMDAQLLLWIVDRYTKPRDTILDPMAGSGTTMLGCTTGRNVVQVELEKKFVDMQHTNWEKVKMMPQLGHEMGECRIIQGDARNLEGLLVDKCIFSPPYAETGASGKSRSPFWERLAHDPTSARYGRDQHPSIGEGYSENPSNIGNLSYGEIDKIVTSPPYAEAQSGGGIAQRGYQGSKHSPTDLVGKRSYMPEQAGQADGQISALSYGSIDAVINSPPYEASVSDNKESPLAGGNEAKYGRWKDGTAKKISYTQDEPCKVDAVISSPPYEASVSQGEGPLAVKAPHATTGDKMLTNYSNKQSNIGNLKGDTYLSAMLQVYQQCHKVLKPGGLMIVVTKNFIRNKKEVRLDEDTIRLCEQAGFRLVEHHYRKLPAQSFWRTIYQQKYPDAPVLDKEDILVFQKTT